MNSSQREVVVVVATCEAVVGDELAQLVAGSGRGVVGVQRLAGRRRVTVSWETHYM